MCWLDTLSDVDYHIWCMEIYYVLCDIIFCCTQDKEDDPPHTHTQYQTLNLGRKDLLVRTSFSLTWG